jgi:hypothetical protein
MGTSPAEWNFILGQKKNEKNKRSALNKQLFYNELNQS